MVATLWQVFWAPAIVLLCDPNGIRPGYYFEDDEVFAVASERAPLMTVFNKKMEEISEIAPGGIIVFRPDGSLIKEQFCESSQRASGCSFERIYFSRGNDPDIYAELADVGCFAGSTGYRVSGWRFLEECI